MEETKQGKAPEVEKRDEMIEACIRREAVIKSKFPDILKAPKSIQDEYFEITGVKNALQVSRKETWGKTIAFDGCEVDAFVVKRYEEALAKSSVLKKENETYITPEEEEAFEFPEIDFDSLREELDSVETFDERRELYNKVMDLSQEPLPENIQEKLHDLGIEVGQKEVSYVKEEDKVPVPVKQSKFAQIYQKAKGKLKGVVDNLKSRFNNKEKNIEEKDNEQGQEYNNDGEER
jgi:hypothetical protein